MRSDYKNNPRKDNPADRSSLEAVYYLSDYWEQYYDGDQNNTDISKYFKYSYDKSTNKVTFTFTPGYNKTDGDWQTDRSHPNGTISIYYAVNITNDEFWNDLKNESNNYSNTLEYEGKKQMQHTEVNRETQNVSKTAKQIENTTNVEYSVVINPAAKDLNPTSEKKVMDVNDTEGTKTGWQDSADYDIGDKVPFQLTGTVADDYYVYKGDYQLVFHDTLSEGLTVDRDSFKIYKTTG